MLFYIMYYVLLQCTNDLIFLYNFTFDIRIRLLVKDDGFTHACHMYKTFYQNTHIICEISHHYNPVQIYIGNSTFLSKIISNSEVLL